MSSEDIRAILEKGAERNTEFNDEIRPSWIDTYTNQIKSQWEMGLVKRAAINNVQNESLIPGIPNSDEGGYIPTRDDIKGLPVDVARKIWDSTSKHEVEKLKLLHDWYSEERKIASQGDHLSANLLGGMTTLEMAVPLFGVTPKKGFVDNVLGASVPVGTTVAASELLRTQLDPTSTAEEPFVTTAMGTVLGSVVVGGILTGSHAFANFGKQVDAGKRNIGDAADDGYGGGPRKEYKREDFPDKEMTEEEFAEFINGDVDDGLGDVARYQMNDGRRIVIRENEDGTHTVLDIGEQSNKPFDPDAEVTAVKEEFGHDLVFETRPESGSLGGARQNEDGTWRISLDRSKIATDYESGMQYLRGVGGPTAKQKIKVFDGIDLDVLKKWFDDNGGVDAYTRFIIRHEMTHASKGHVVYAPKDLETKAAISQELEANSQAFKDIGLDEASLRQGRPMNIIAEAQPGDVARHIDGANAKRVGSFESPEAHIFKNTESGVGVVGDKADEFGVPVRKTTVAERKADREIEIQRTYKSLDNEIEALNKEIGDNGSQAKKDLINERRRINNRIKKGKASDEDAPRLEQVKTELAELRKKTGGGPEGLVAKRNLLLEERGKISRFLDELEAEGLSAEDFALKEMPFGLERRLSALDMPWYRLTGNKLRELSPALAKPFIILARRLAASPDLIQKSTNGGTLGSVEGMAKQWTARYQEAMIEVDSLYNQMNGGDALESTFMGYVRDEARGGKEFINKAIDKVKGKRAHDVVPETDPIRLAEFHEEVGEAQITGVYRNDYVRKAAKVMQDHLDSVGKELEELGILKTDKGIQQRIKILTTRADGLEQFAEDAITAEARDLAKSLMHKARGEAKSLSETAKLKKDPRLFFDDSPFFHRVWDEESVREGMDELTGILTEHYRRQPYIIVEGEVKSLSIHPDAIAKRVDDTIKQILDELDAGDTLGTIVKGGKERTGVPSELIGRGLDIPNKLVSNFIVKNTALVNRIYTARVGGHVEMARKFGDSSIKAHLEDLRLQALDEIGTKIDPSKAVKDIDLSLNKLSSKAKKIMEEIDALERSARDLRDVVLGNYYTGPDPSAISSRVARGLMQYNMITSMGQVLYIQMNDIGKAVATYGLRAAFGGLFKRLTTSLKTGSEWSMAVKEVKLAGSAWDLMTNQRMYELLGAHGDMIGKSAIERSLSKWTGRTFIMNLMSPWTDLAKGTFGAMAQSRMIEDALNWSSLSARKKTELARIGFTKRFAQTVVDNWKAAGGNKGDDLYLANTGNWADTDAVRQFRAMLADEVDRVVMTPGAATQPLWVHNDWVKPIIQYKKFSISATQNLLMAGLQRGEMKFVTAMLSMVAMSLVIDAKKRPDYINLPWEDQLFRAVEISGITGIILDGNQMLEGATGGDWGARAALGLKNKDKDNNLSSKIGSIAGPASNQWGTLIQAMVDPDSTTQQQGRALRYIVPWNNMLWWNDMTNRIQRASVDLVEEIED